MDKAVRFRSMRELAGILNGKKMKCQLTKQLQLNDVNIWKWLRQRMKTTMRLFLAGSFLLIAFTLMAGTNEFWVSTNATHLFYDDGTTGSVDRPLDGSTLANFQRNMSSFPENTIIHLLPGTYQTIGVMGMSNAMDGRVMSWSPRSGQKILGSGMDVTILQMPAKEMKTNGILHWASVGGAGAAVIAGNWGFGRSNIDICDLTLDCNYLPGSKCTLHGIQLEGRHHAIRRVKVINTAKFGGNLESWAIQISNGDTNVISDGNIIEGCEVSHFQGGDANVSGIWIEGANTSGIIRSNCVYGDLTRNTPLFAALGIASGTALSPSLIEDNHVEGAVNVLYDEAGFNNLVVSNNVCINCGTFMSLSAEYVQNFTVISNTIVLTNNIWDGRPSVFAELKAVSSSQKPSFYTNINVIGNMISFAGETSGCSQLACFIGSNIHGLTVADNRIDGRLTNSFSNCSDLHFTNNISTSEP